MIIGWTKTFAIGKRTSLNISQPNDDDDKCYPSSSGQ